MAVFHLLSDEESKAWVDAFPEVGRAVLTDGLTAHGESLGESLSAAIVNASKQLALGMVLAALIIGVTTLGVTLGGACVFVGSVASAAAAV